jgi:hypothetical protein
VRARGGSWAADVRASLWLGSRLLLQIAAAEGRADGNSNDDDIPVSEKKKRMVMGVRRGTHQGSLTNKACVDSTKRFPYERTTFDSLSKHTGLYRAIVLLRWWGASETGGRGSEKEDDFLVWKDFFSHLFKIPWTGILGLL